MDGKPAPGNEVLAQGCITEVGPRIQPLPGSLSFEHTDGETEAVIILSCVFTGRPCPARGSVLGPPPFPEASEELALALDPLHACYLLSSLE